MAITTVKSSARFNWRRLLKILGGICAILFVLLVIGYFVVTSSGFFKGVILPKVSKAAGADVTVSDASIHPFSGVVLSNVKVQAKGEETLLTAKEVRVGYSLWAIIHGNIVVSEVTMVSPVISVVTKADGTSNLPKPPASESKPSKETKPSTTAASKPLRVDIKKVAITGATIRNTQQFTGGKDNIAEITDFNFTLENIKNGQTAKVAIRFDATVANGSTNMAGLLNASSTGEFAVALSDDLNPATVSGGLQLNVSRATGALAELAGLNASLQTDISPTEIKNLSLGFQRSAVKLGEVRASGPFVLAKQEGHLNVEIRSIDRRVLNLAGAASGMDFGTTTINSTNRIDVTAGGKVIAASGSFNLAKLQIIRAKQTTPTIDVTANYDVTVDLNGKTGSLRLLTINGDQNSSPFLRAELDKPMNLAWGEAAGNMGDSTLNATLINFNLADWKPFIGDMVSSGTVNAKVKLVSQNGGKQLTFDVASAIENLSATASGNKISQAGVGFTLHGQAVDMKQIQLDNYKVEVTHLKDSVVTLAGSGSYDMAAQSADLQITLQANVPNVLATFPQPGDTAQSGTATLKAHVIQKGTTQTVTGTFALGDFTGAIGGSKFNSFATDVNLDLGMDGTLVQLRQIAGKLTQGGNAGGNFAVSGQYDTAKSSGKFDIKLDGLNENAVRPFLEPMLADKKLVSVNINGTANAQLDPKGASSVKADFQMTNLKVNDPTGQVPSTPLEAKLQLDTSLDKQIADVRKFQITLTPTPRGKNEINFSGRVDMTKANTFQGNMKLAADSLDLTTYYDLFAGQTNAAATTAASKPVATSTPSPTQPETEPAAMNLPFQNFIVEAVIGKLYLREIEITGFQTSLKLDSNKILLKPFQLVLNAAPVTALIDLNVGVPGYQYDVTFDANKVPLTPLVNSLMPDRKGQIGGTALAKGHIIGAGITGVNLQKNLNGQFDISTTNMNLALINVQSPILKTVVNTIAAIPQMLKDPATALTDIASGVLGGKTDAGFTGKLTSAPINAIELHGIAGKGVVNMQQAIVQSSAFQAEAPGTVTLAAVFNESKLNFPVTVSFEKSLAQQISVTPSDPNARYAALPQFLTITGTVGVPKPNIDKLALVKIAGKTGVGIYNAITGATGGTNSAGAKSQEQKLIKEGINIFQNVIKKK